jgi:hypothetical protein
VTEHHYAFILATIVDTQKVSKKQDLKSISKAVNRSDEKTANGQELIILQENDKTPKAAGVKFDTKLLELMNTLLTEIKQEREIHQKEIRAIKEYFIQEIAENRRFFLKEVEQLRQELQHLKVDSITDDYHQEQEIAPANTSEKNHRANSFVQLDQSSHKTAGKDGSYAETCIDHLEDLLNTLKDFNQSAGDETGSQKKRNAKIEELNELPQEQQVKQIVQSGNKASGWITDSPTEDNNNDLDDHDDVQQEIFNMIREIAQEKGKQELKFKNQ